MGKREAKRYELLVREIDSLKKRVELKFSEGGDWLSEKTAVWTLKGTWQALVGDWKSVTPLGVRI